MWDTCVFLTMKEEQRLKISETKLLRRIVGSKRVEVTGRWRKLHNEELLNLCLSPNVDEIERACSTHGEMINAHEILVAKAEGMRPSGTYKCKWYDNIKMNLKETGCEIVDGIQLAQDRVHWWAVMKKIMNLWFP